MGPVQAIKIGVRRSFQFSGHASRSETWWFALFIAFSWIPIYQSSIYLKFRFTIKDFFIFTLVLLVPYFFSLARRIHDINLPGWIAALPFGLPFLLSILGAIVVGDPIAAAIFWMFGIFAFPIIVAIAMSVEGTPGPNKYGPNPLEASK